MPDKLVAILFYWSLNTKSPEFLLSSLVSDFCPKYSIKQSLALRTHYEVLGLEPIKSSKMSCPRLEDSIAFLFGWKLKRKITKHKYFLNSVTGVVRIFYWEGGIRKSLAIWRHHKFSKERTFLGSNIPSNERSEAWGLGWCVNRMLLKGENLNQSKCF